MSLSQTEVNVEVEVWPPEKKAEAGEWLLEQRLERVRKRMGPIKYANWILSLYYMLEIFE